MYNKAGLSAERHRGKKNPDLSQTGCPQVHVGRLWVNLNQALYQN